MTTAGQSASGGGWFGKLVVVLLLVLAIGLYLQIVMVDNNHGESASAPQASVQAVKDPAPAAAAEQTPQDLPQGQMDLIRQVFAPELSN